MLIGCRLEQNVLRTRGDGKASRLACCTRLRRCRPYSSALGQPILSIDDDTLAGRQAFGYDRYAVLDGSNLHGTPLNGIVWLDDIRVVTARTCLDGLLGNRSHAV